MVAAPLERDSLAGRSFHDELGEGQAAFPCEGARLMGGHEDAVPAPAVPGVGGVLRVVGLLRAPGERAVLAALALLQDEVAVLDRDGVLLHADDRGRQVRRADVRDGADACVVGVGEVPDRLDTTAATEELPRIGEFDGSDIRRMLTRAWVDIMEWRDLAPAQSVRSTERIGVPDSSFITAGWTSPRAALRRLATALEVHAVLVPGLPAVTVQACAFVAAEALSICNEQPDPEVPLSSASPLGSARRYEQLEAGLLYRIAGYDANAARCGGEIGELDTPIDAESPASEWAMGTFRELLAAQVSPDLPQAPPVPSRSEHLDVRVRHALWRKMGQAVRRHTQWLTHQPGALRTAVEDIRTLISLLHPDADGWGGQVVHPDIHHIAVLLAKVLEEDETRALRSVPTPPDEDGRFASYVQEQAKSRPLLWPSARIYSEQALPGPHAHAVVCVPTGAGKSAVAELAIAQTLHRGWVLYLAPTNALVGQLVRRLSSVFESLPGVQVRGFLGGAEYALLESEDLAVIGSCQVLVMTPEKCSLALRQNPDAFEDLRLCILDEAHLIEEPNGRGALAELVIAEVLHRAPHVRALLMSALVANADELADWLTAVTGVEAVPISHPWRPTRTLRAIAGFDQAGEEAAQALARDRLAALPGSRKKLTYDAPISLLVGLQGAWATNHPKDYRVVRTPVLSPKELHRTDGPSPTGVCLPMTAAIVTAMADKGHRWPFFPKTGTTASLRPSSCLDPRTGFQRTMTRTSRHCSPWQMPSSASNRS